MRPPKPSAVTNASGYAVSVGLATSGWIPVQSHAWTYKQKGTVMPDIQTALKSAIDAWEPTPTGQQLKEKHMFQFTKFDIEEHRAVTEQWLNENGFKYHGILFGKPRGGNYHWVDNHIVRATRYEGHFTDLVLTDAKIQVFNNES